MSDAARTTRELLNITVIFLSILGIAFSMSSLFFRKKRDMSDGASQNREIDDSVNPDSN